MRYVNSLVDLAPGQYALCWCREQCSLHQAVVELGRLKMEGPESGQERVCVRGHPCALQEISGVGLEEGDAARVLLECGTNTPVARVPGSGIANTTDGETYTFGAQNLLAEASSGGLDVVFVFPIAKLCVAHSQYSLFRGEFAKFAVPVVAVLA